MESWSPVKVEVTNLNIEDEQPSTVKHAAKALSDGSREESPTLSYKHRWTTQQRLTLATLAEIYSNNWSERTAVFNHFHRSDFRGSGGLRKTVVATQFHTMRKRCSYDRPKLASQPGLEKAALDISIQLSLKKATASSNRITISNPHNRSGCKRKRDRTDFLPDRSDDDDQTASHVEKLHSLTLLPKTPTKRNGKRQESALLTPPDSRERKIPRLTVDKKLARIGFRASTTKTQGTYSSVLGIRAGAFVNQATVPIARNLESISYDKEVLHHVTKYDFSRPSMFISATKNPIRTFHMLLHAPEDKKDLILIDLHAADEEGNVQKASDLRLQTDFKYSAASEYLIFGGVPPDAIIANIPLSRLLDEMPTTPESDDPFFFKVLQRHNKLSNARLAIKGKTLPMTFCLGKAVGELVGLMCIPPKHYQTGVWALVQDYKFYNAEGGRKKGNWSENVAFRAGALQGYQAARGTLTSLEVQETNKKLATEVIEILDDSESDSDLDGDHQIPMEVDVKTSRWMTRGEDVSYNFLAELREVVDRNGFEMEGDAMVQDNMEASESHGRDKAANLTPKCQRIDSDRNGSQGSQDIDELCADVNHMHGNVDHDSGSAADKTKIDYEFGWTGM